MTGCPRGPASAVRDGARVLPAPPCVYAPWGTGGYVTLTWPGGVENHPVRGRAGGGIPVTGDTGDGAVVSYHIKPTPTDYAGISCSGFRAK